MILLELRLPARVASLEAAQQLEVPLVPWLLLEQLRAQERFLPAAPFRCLHLLRLQRLRQPLQRPAHLLGHRPAVLQQPLEPVRL